MGCAIDDKAKASKVKTKNVERIWTVCSVCVAGWRARKRFQVLYEDYSVRQIDFIMLHMLNFFRELYTAVRRVCIILYHPSNFPDEQRGSRWLFYETTRNCYVRDLC